jgi:choline dehydrogenase-like flavoprotein
MKKEIDVLIIGSGPIGATFARIISDQKPGAKILMIDLGPRLTDKAGQHLKNIPDPAIQADLQIKSQGSKQTPYPNISVAQRAQAVQKGELNADILARAGTHLATDTPEDLASNQMPSASMSSNIGGMGAHWTCACPRPGNAERIPFIPEAEYEKAFKKAEELLCVTQKAFPETPESLAILRTLGSVFNEKLSSDRQVQPMPLACQVNEKGERYWTGADLILGNMAEVQDTSSGNFQSSPNFEIRSETLCRRLFTEGGKITGVLIEHLPTGKQEEIQAKIVIVAADALRTPQLLWASGIRPKALGHYLNEHPFIFTFVELKEDLVDKTVGNIYDPNSRTEPTIGVFWVPFDAPHHPFHGQIMHMDLSPLKTETFNNPKHIVGLGWGCLKEVQYEDCIEFSETETDWLGMPKMNFKFAYTEGDKKAIEQAKTMQTLAVEAFGKVIKDGDQTLMPPGTSLHYEGTTRMGETNDGASVCDSYAQVWDFDNLFVGGNGVIPTATTSNPTLTSVAMAVRSAEKIVDLL